jgi:hypothetical protein
MHTSGPGPTSAAMPLPYLTPLSPVQRPAVTAPVVALTGPSSAPPSAVPAPSSTQSAVSTPPPPGADPTLWNVLTQDEQEFFQQMAALGPLTYGARPSQSTPEAPVGQRLDVRG